MFRVASRPSKIARTTREAPVFAFPARISDRLINFLAGGLPGG